MENKKQSKIIVGVVLIFMMFMFLGPITFMGFIDGFSSFMMVPILMVVSFFVFAFIILKSSTAQINAKKKEMHFTSDDRHCVSCHESIGVNHQFCPYCGSEQLDYIVCDYCGEKNSKHRSTCSKCNGLLK